jgi:SAM-dependent methyltransferase
VYWPELVAEWELGPEQATHLDSRESWRCGACRATLRSQTLARAIQAAVGSRLPLPLLGLTRPWLRVLQCNHPGSLRRWLRTFPRTVYGDYPAVDMQAMPYPDDTFHLVLHSDTLEHVPDTRRALSECWRVTRPGGYTCYTIPVVVGRPSRSRHGLPASFHGSSGKYEYLVHTEYGDDFWHEPLEAGFSSAAIVADQYPASFALVCQK